MEMTYGGALVMPSSYAMMDEEEMMYLEAGETFYGVWAYNEITNIIAAAASFAGLAASCYTAAIGGALLCWNLLGVCLEYAALLGGQITLGIALYNLTIAVVAAELIQKYGGYRVKSFSVCGFSVYYDIGRP